MRWGWRKGAGKGRAGRERRTVNLDLVVVVQNDELAQAEMAVAFAFPFPPARTRPNPTEPDRTRPNPTEPDQSALSVRQTEDKAAHAPGQRRRLGADALLQAAIAAHDEGVVVNDVEPGTVEHRRQVRLGDGQADTVRKACRGALKLAV